MRCSAAALILIMALRVRRVCAYAFRVAFVRDENNVVHPTKHNAKREVECVAAMNI